MRERRKMNYSRRIKFFENWVKLSFRLSNQNLDDIFKSSRKKVPRNSLFLVEIRRKVILPNDLIVLEI